MTARTLPQVACYSKSELPRDLAVQVVSFVRMQWPFMLGQKTPLWESTPYPEDGKHFVIADGDALISHALAHQKRIEHAGEMWDVGALSSVFTYPTHRGGGFGEQVVAAATEDLRKRNIDLALLFCGNRVRSLYLRTGWTHRPNLRVTFGDPTEPKRFYNVHPESYVMSLLVSERARAAIGKIEAQPMFVGANTW